MPTIKEQRDEQARVEGLEEEIADLRRQLAEGEKGWQKGAREFIQIHLDETRRQLEEAEGQRDGFAADLDHAEDKLEQVTQERDDLKEKLGVELEKFKSDGLEGARQAFQEVAIQRDAARIHAKALAEALEGVVDTYGLGPDDATFWDEMRAVLTAWQEFEKGEASNG